MPYFQRKPVEEFQALVKPALKHAVFASRGPGPARANDTKSGRPDEKSPDIVALADAVLASEMPAGRLTHADARTARPSSSQIPHAEEPARKSRRHEAPVPRPEVSRSDAGDVPEPAPVVPATSPVAPGGTARIVVPLVNEDDRPAQIEFFGTGLVGDNGALIPANCVSCPSRGLTLEAGVSGDVEIEVSVPANARAGVYAGLVRASRLDDVHAVIVIRVDES